VLLEDEPDLIRLEPEDQESFSPIEIQTLYLCFCACLILLTFPPSGLIHLHSDVCSLFICSFCCSVIQIQPQSYLCILIYLPLLRGSIVLARRFFFMWIHWWWLPWWLDLTWKAGACYDFSRSTSTLSHSHFSTRSSPLSWMCALKEIFSIFLLLSFLCWFLLLYLYQQSFNFNF
jgi:hypothetical protein